ncbi:twin-arginine translocation pathway signal protein [Limnohabitans sp.]|uniref:dioxygenase family protein n=1 Tax=Limnohabitans sp. TaxID=1907725 RepID=UPI00286EDEAC|nr:twin-arginine translocation pathway signal protein [Limnohabitans sp.]
MSNQSESIPSRRGFLKTAMTSAATSAGAVVGTANAAQQCAVTGGDILGPFYRPDAAMSATSIIQLVKPEEKGRHIVLTGRVLRPDCKTPVVNAIVDVWQANAEGMYDIKTPDEVIAPANYYMRGQARTNDKGEFILQTIVPGKYRIPPGLENFEKFEGYLRPAHIHLTVTHPVYLPLTTQLYFNGDPQIAKDPWAKHSKNMVKMNKDQGTFEVVLGNTPPHKS